MFNVSVKASPQRSYTRSCPELILIDDLTGQLI